MSVLSESYRSRSLSSRRSTSLRRKRSLRQESVLYGNDYSLDNPRRWSVRPQALSLRGVSPKPSAIDPELRDAQKQGSRYHIAMNLNALLDFPFTDRVASFEKQKRDNSQAMMHRLPPYSLHHSTLLKMTPATRSTVVSGRQSGIKIERDNIDNYNLSTLVNGTKMVSGDDCYAIRSVNASSIGNVPQVVGLARRSAYDEGYVIRSVTPNPRIKESVETGNIGDESVSFDLQLIGTESLRSRMSKATQQNSDNLLDYEDTANSIAPTQQLLQNKDSRWNDKVDDVEPSFSMTINETMTMDYYRPEEPKGFQNRSSISQQVKGSRPTHSKSIKESEKDKAKSRSKLPQIALAVPAVAAAPEAAPRSGQRKLPKSGYTEKPSREPEKASKTLERSLQRHWPTDQVEIAKNLEGIRQNRAKTIKTTDDADKDFVLRDNLDIAPNNEASFYRNAFGQSTRSTSLQQPIRAFAEQDTEMRRVSNVPTGPIGQHLPMSPRRTLFQREELIPPGTAKLSRINNNGSDDEYQTEIKITRGRNEETKTRSPIALPPLQPRIPTTMTSTYVRQLMKDAPDGSFRQRMDVHREEAQITGPLPQKPELLEQDSMTDMLNVDLISEKVNMMLVDGVAHLVVTVRCERIVPIHGSVDLYKKTSIVVRRCIDVDLTVTEERKIIFDQVMKNCLSSGNLSNRDTFELYIAFMEVAELHPSSGLDQEKLWIDKKVEEERVGKYASLEKKLEEGDNDFTTRKFGAGQDGISDAQGRFMSARNVVSGPASTQSFPESFLTSPENCYGIYYDVPDSVVLPSSGYQATSFRSMSGNGSGSSRIQTNGSENNRDHRSQTQSADRRSDKQFANETFHLLDVTTSNKNLDAVQRGGVLNNREASLKNSRSKETSEKGDGFWTGQVNWPEAIDPEQFRGDIGPSARPKAISGAEEEYISLPLIQCQERIRELNKNPSYQVLQIEEKSDGEYFDYEDTKSKTQNESKYNEPIYREPNAEHLRSSGFTRTGKTSIVC